MYYNNIFSLYRYRVFNRRSELPAFLLHSFQEAMHATRDKLGDEMLYCCFHIPAAALHYQNIVIHWRQLFSITSLRAI